MHRLRVHKLRRVCGAKETTCPVRVAVWRSCFHRSTINNVIPKISTAIGNQRCESVKIVLPSECFKCPLRSLAFPVESPGSHRAIGSAATRSEERRVGKEC